MSEMIRLKYVSSINEGVLAEDADPGFEFLYVDISAVGQGTLALPAEPTRFAVAPSRARRLAVAGDTVVSTVRTYLRAVTEVPATEDPLVFSTGFAVISPDRQRVYPRYLTWQLQADNFISTVESISTGVSYPATSAAAIGDIGVRIPPLDVQRAVANFLDRETAKIDALIAKQERLLALLDEREDALRKAWTLGHTQGAAATRIGRVLERLERPPAEPAPIVTAYRDGQVTSRGVRREDGYTLSFTEHGYQGVEVGDLVFHGLDGFAGAVGVAEVSGKCSPVYHVCRAREGHDAEYLAQHIRALGVSRMLEKFAWSVRQRSADYRNWALFAALPIAVPSLHEQREAADEIRRARERASRLRRSAKACIDLLRERRAALITAAVTGRLDVTTYGKAG